MNYYDGANAPETASFSTSSPRTFDEVRCEPAMVKVMAQLVNSAGVNIKLCSELCARLAVVCAAAVEKEKVDSARVPSKLPVLHYEIKAQTDILEEANHMLEDLLNRLEI